VQELDVDAADMESVASVSELLECLAQCGSPVLQSLAVLQSGADQSESARVSALEVLRGLPRERVAVVSSDEVSAVEVVLGCIEVSADAGVRVSAWLCLHLGVGMVLQHAERRSLCVVHATVKFTLSQSW
jgi:hypothetical protein